MAENKYITQNQENGSVLIAEEVLVNIISVAVGEVEGAELSGKPGINWGKGIKLTIDEESRVAVKCYINVDFNQSVVAIAANVQENVANALESMAGVTVLSVNVSVVGVTRK
ncbi:MAG: Asp23/Gls24 family envelope stress response protein [Oscillospiraceae bacterium]|nr:Asp23/Gls24 family envelope stress response protein [Oscillospiraceae bacterium]